MKLPTLFSNRDSGGLQEWTVEVEGNKLRTISGMVNGKLVISKWVACDGKNIGRSNATSPEEQAISEAKSKWQKRFDKGYREHADQLGDPTFFEPMLAKNVNDHWDDLKYPIYCQPKLDGIRVVATKKGMYSRNGKTHHTLGFIHETLKPIFDKYPNLVIDGEGYADKLNDDFNKIVSLIKKSKPTEDDIEDCKRLIRYHVYDCHMGGDETFSERNKFIRQVLADNPYVVLVSTFKIDSRVQLDEMYEKFLEGGYEGQMVRQDTAYENKRTKNLLKRKEFIDKEYKILSVHEGMGNREGTVGYMSFQTEDGRPFNSNVKGDFTHLRELWAHRAELPGKYATIKYFNLSKDAVPRFPFVIAIRDYE